MYEYIAKRVWPTSDCGAMMTTSLHHRRRRRRPDPVRARCEWGSMLRPNRQTKASLAVDSRLAKSCVFIVLMPIYLRWVWNVRRGALCVSSCVLCYVLTCAYSEWICDVWWVGSLALYVSRWTRKPDRAIRDYQKSQSGLCLSVPYRLTIPEQYIYCIYLLCRQTVEDRKVSLAVVDQKDDQP